MTTEISISLLLKVLKSAWWKILLITLAVAIAVAAFSSFFIPKKYSSSVEFYVINASYANEYTTGSLLDATPKLAKDYIKIIKSDNMIEKIITELTSGEGERKYDSEKLTPAYVKPLISGSTSDNSSFFHITVTSTNNELAYDIAKAIEKHAPEVVKDTVRYDKDKITDDEDNPLKLYIYKKDENKYVAVSDIECIRPTITPSNPSVTPVSPDVLTNTMIASIATVVVSYALFFVVKLFDTVIHGEESAKTLVNLPIIGKVPSWDAGAKNTTGNNKAKEYKK